MCNMVVRLLLAVVFLASVCCTRKPEGERDWARRIAKETSLPLPPGTRVVQFYEPDYFVDPVWVAKIEVPKPFHEAFIAAIAGKTADPTHVNNRFAYSVPWWHPKETKLVKQYLVNRQTMVYVIVSVEDGKAVAYLECMVF